MCTRIFNFREFLIDPSGIVRLKPGAKPTCTSCELIVVATDEEGGSSIARVGFQFEKILLEPILFKNIRRFLIF